MGWIVLIFIIFFMGYFIWEFPYALLFFIPFFIINYFLSKKYENKLRALASRRVGFNIGTFAKSFDCKKVDTWVIRAVYEQLQEYIVIKDFPVLATDDIWKDLKIDDGDFSYDILEEIAQRTGRTLDNLDKNPYFSGTTVKDIVLLFNEQKILKDNKTE